MPFPAGRIGYGQDMLKQLARQVMNGGGGGGRGRGGRAHRGRGGGGRHGGGSTGARIGSMVERYMRKRR